MPNKQPTGFVLYRGPSLLDGAPIVAVAIVSSSNRKTGDMVQTYILREDLHPIEALRTGADASICGDCKHRPALGGACYVVVPQGPAVVWKTLQRGRYPVAQDAHAVESLGRGRMVRLGTYGDPAAVPLHIWQHLVRHASGRTGYTHQWRNVPAGQSAPVLRSLVMASADTPEEAEEARAMGWRTFRVMVPGEVPAAREFTCPASEEAGKRATCATCGACDGAERGAYKASPVILAHGSKARRFIAIRAAA